MIFYASGAITDAPTLDLVLERKISILTSYAYKGAIAKHMPYLAQRLRASNTRMNYMVDSGAFTAWNKGKEVRLRALISFYNDLADKYSDVMDFVFVALDKIPGRQGVERTAEDFAAAAQETLRNFDLMREQVHGYCKPVYHDGDPEYLLDAYATHPYISLSVNQDLAYWKREVWVREQEVRLRQRGFYYHGLAMTGTDMLRAIKWHSVDSAAWVLWSAMGAIAWVRQDGSLMIRACSNESPRKKIARAHLSNLTDIEKEEVREVLTQVGVTMEDVARDALARARVNIVQFDRACTLAEQKGVLREGMHRVLGAEGGLFDA